MLRIASLSLPVLLGALWGAPAVSAPSAPLSAAAPAAATPAPSRKAEPVQVRLQTSDKVELSAQYFAPERVEEKVPGVLLVHDQGSKGADLLELAEYLANKGLGVLLLDLRGHGDSKDEVYDWKKADEKQQRAIWALAPKDLEAGAEFLSKRKELHSSKLVLMAHGKSSSLVVPHAIKDRNTLSTVLIQPEEKVYDFELKKELVELDGLPTLLMCGKGAKKAMAQVREAASPKGVEDSTCEVSCLTSKPKDVLSDKRLPKTVYNWLKEQI